MENIKGRPMRGVSVYSYSGEFGITMNLEDCFRDMQDMGATCVEILANGHIDGYPNPSDEWVGNWFRLCNDYGIVPGEFGHWVDSRLYKGRELTTKESVEMLIPDMKLANRLGFTVLRTKLGVIDDDLNPVENWREFITEALPYAEEYNVRMCPEIHLPTLLKSKMVEDYVEFIEKTGTKHFGLNIDFGVFQNKFPKELLMYGSGENAWSEPEDMKALIPYIYCCHAKFNYMDENFEELTIPYAEVLKVLVDGGYNGFMVSEYEGRHKDEPGFVSEQLKRQHIMMKRILGY